MTSSWKFSDWSQIRPKNFTLHLLLRKKAMVNECKNESRLSCINEKAKSENRTSLNFAFKSSNPLRKRSILNKSFLHGNLQLSVKNLWLYCTLYDQRTFTWPKNFYMTHKLLYGQSNFYMTNEILHFIFLRLKLSEK